MDRAVARGKLGWSQETRHVLFPAARDRPEKRFGLARAAVAEARASGVPIELHELDGVGRDDVPLWLNGSDAVLLTSTHEGSPNVVKEALACDVPVVSVDVGDVSERVAGVDGCHIAAATPGDLASKLLLALSSQRPEARRAVEEIALPRIAERLQAIYETVAAR